MIIKTQGKEEGWIGHSVVRHSQSSSPGIKNRAMTLQTELVEMGKARLTQLKVLLDELQLQLTLGKSEAREAFERESKNFRQFIRDYKEQFKRENEELAAHRTQLSEKLEALEKLLTRELASSKKKFDQDKKEVLHAIHELESVLEDTYGEVSQLLQNKLDSFKGRLDAYRVQLALGEYEIAEELASKKSALRNAVNEVVGKLKKEESTGEKIDHFSEEVNKSVDHLRKAFSDLFA